MAFPIATHSLSWRKTDSLLASLVGLFTLVHIAYYFPRVVDDLYISLRYAENIANGLGAVYNEGERVEGYSSPLWMLLQAFGFLVGFEGVTWTKLLGCLSLLGLEWTLFVTMRVGFRLTGAAAWLPSIYCACNSYIVNWTVLGLETPLFLFLFVLAPLAVHNALTRADRSSRIVSAIALSAFGLTRPEAPLYLIATGIGFALSHAIACYRLAQFRELARRLAWALLPAAAILGGAVLLRWLYYGEVVPNTYFVKGAERTFRLDNLAPLWGQGVGVAESAVLLGGSVLTVYYSYKRRILAYGLCLISCLGFTASVILDWMPSLRHLLPVTALAPVGWACSAAELARLVGSKRWLSVVPITTLTLGASWVTQVDNRNSPEEKRGRDWVRAKTIAKWRDTILSYRRVEPPHVKRMGTYSMGQITQAWHVLEASKNPVSKSWYIGRDIGAVGYYTGVRVYDTAGLFTLQVSKSKDWTNKRRVTKQMIRKAMSIRPLAGEIYEGWDRALGRQPKLLKGYRIRTGNKRRPIAFLATNRKKPSKQEVLTRYRQMLARFPTWYHVHTLYGESLGAAVEKRVRVVEKKFGK